MKSDILKSDGIVERILMDLSVYCDIPNKGFLAGGAVSNMLMKYVWEDNYPINDLDVFYETEDSSLNLNGNEPTTPIRTNELVVEGDGYNVTKLSYDHGSNYRILNVSMVGLLNTIEISRVSNREHRNDYQYILKGFDFNCCQVGIDLESNRLFYTDGFETFLNHKQLEVTAIYTPAHTAIRLFKKMDDLKCYCNIEESMELLSQPLILQNMIQLRQSHFGIYFSTKYKEMYMKYYGKIKNYFKMVKFFDHKKMVYNERINFESTIPDNHALNWLDGTNSIPQNLLDSWAKYNDIMWTLSPKKYNRQNDKITEILIGLNYNPLTFMNAYKVISNKIPKKLKEKADKVLLDKFWLCRMAALVNDKFYDCDFDTKHIESIERFVDKDRWALTYIVKEKLNIQESYEFITNIKKVLNKEGDWVSELILRFLENKNSVIKPTYENLMVGVSKEKEKYAHSLVNPIDISNFEPPKGVKIKELVSELDLKWGGRKLNNCLNNPGQDYKGKIESEIIKVFVIITENNMSAMEIELIEGTVYKSRQLLSFCNKVTSEYHKVVSNILLNFINMNHLKDIYESKLKSYESIDILNRGFLINLDDEKTDKNPSGSFLNLDIVNPMEQQVLRYENEDVAGNWTQIVTEHERWNDPNVFDDLL